MDADDDLSDPITLITDPAKSLNNPDNPALTAGFRFLGHDMTGSPPTVRRAPSLRSTCSTPLTS